MFEKAVLARVFGAKAEFRQNAAFVMNRKTQALLRKFKDASGKYRSKTHLSSLVELKRKKPRRSGAMWWKRFVEVVGIVSAIVAVVRLYRCG